MGVMETTEIHRVLSKGINFSHLFLDAEDLLRLGDLGLSRLIYSFHYYLSLLFTHQGAEWAGNPLATLQNIPYPIPASEVLRLRETARVSGFEEGPFAAHPEGFDRTAMNRSLEKLFRFSEKEKLPLYCGGFGAYKPFAPPAARANWIKDLVQLLNEKNVPWALWAYRADFDLVDSRGVPDEAVVRALGFSKG